MTNLKKVTALSLAASSILGTVASAATFTDTNDISNVEAVNMLTALGVIKGFEDGSFRPESTVTRAEMAKMIFTIKSAGNDDASAFADSSNSALYDIKGHWAEGYINYCETMGIISGYGDGTFRPDANVTSAEALKMALVTLGYTADNAGLTGSNWYNTTLALAINNSLTDDITGVTFNAASSRDVAAQILYNALDAYVVRYDANSGEFVSTTTVAGATAITLAESAMNLVKQDGLVTGISKDAVEIDGVSYDAYTDYVAYSNQKVTALIDDKKGYVYGLTPDKNTSSIVAFKDDVTVDEDNETVSYNGVTIKNFADFSIVDNAHDNDLLIIAKNGSDDAIVKLVKTTVAQVKYVNDDKVIVGFITGDSTLNQGTEFSTEDIQISSSVEVDDYISITPSLFKELDVAAELSTVTGTIDATRTVDNVTEYRINSTWYDIASSSVDTADLKIDAEVCVAIIGGTIYGTLDVISAAANVSDYIVITKVASILNSTSDTSVSDDISFYEAIVMYTDGTTETVKIAGNDDGEAVNYGEGTESGFIGGSSTAPSLGMYTYETDGNYIMLETVTDEGEFDNYASGSNLSYENDEDNSTIGGFTIADDAVIYVQYDNGDETETITGSNLKTWEKTTIASFKVIANETNGIGEVVVGYINLGSIEDLPGTESDVLFGYVTATPYQVDSYVIVEIFNGSSTTEYKLKGKVEEFNIARGNTIAYTYNDSEIKMATLADAKASQSMGNADGTVSIKGYSSSLITFMNDTEVQIGGSYKLTDDTQYIYINSKDKAGSSYGSLTNASDVDGVETNNKFYKDANAVAFVNSDNEVVAVFVDVLNEMADAAGTLATEK